MAQLRYLRNSSHTNDENLVAGLRRQIDSLVKTVAYLEAVAKAEKAYNRNVWVPVSGGGRQVNLSKVLYCTAESNYTRIWFVDGTKLLLSSTLKSIEIMFASDYFIRVHKSYLVNKEQVQALNTQEGLSLTLQGGHTIPVARARRNDVKCIFQ